ncbi:MAG: hypothetical protein ACJAR2_000377 [Ilumatobacter sp.]|jgi:hypothetical protein
MFDNLALVGETFEPSVLPALAAAPIILLTPELIDAVTAARITRGGRST